MYTEGNESRRDYLKRQIRSLLGGGGVRIELKDDQIDFAIDLALDTYRQRCSGAFEEAFLHLTLEDEQTGYTLPKEVMEVRKIFRRGHGTMGQTSGANLDPFSLAYANNYMMSAVNGSQGGLLTYELQHQFQETMGRMFGREIMFTWNRVSKNLVLHRDVRGQEDIILWAYQSKPEEMLLADYTSSPWLRDWALAESKIILGRVRGKISAIPGPNGNISLNGDALIQEGMQDQQRLLDELKRYAAGGTPLGFIFG